jgi:hypothetical protein
MVEARPMSLGAELTQEERDRLLSFIGYGRLDTPVWFLGMEEGTGGCSLEELAHNLHARAGFRSVMDLREACLLMRFNDEPMDVACLPKSPSSVWLWAANLIEAVLERSPLLRPAAKLDYVRNCLGREFADTLLAELFPLPAASTNNWPYTGWFSTRDDYRREVVTQRVALLHSLLDRHQPRFVFAYGAGHRGTYHERYKQLFNETIWALHEGEKQKFQVARFRNTRVALIPFPGHGRFGMDIAKGLLRVMREL